MMRLPFTFVPLSLQLWTVERRQKSADPQRERETVTLWTFSRHCFLLRHGAATRYASYSVLKGLTVQSVVRPSGMEKGGCTRSSPFISKPLA